jgi:hypothetical protein
MNLLEINMAQYDAWYYLRYNEQVRKSNFWLRYWDGRSWGLAARVRQALIYKVIERLKGVAHG